MKLNEIPHLVELMRQAFPDLVGIMREHGIGRMKVQDLEFELVPMWQRPVHLQSDDETDPSTPSAKLEAGEKHDDDMAYWSADS